MKGMRMMVCLLSYGKVKASRPCMVLQREAPLIARMSMMKCWCSPMYVYTSSSLYGISVWGNMMEDEDDAV